MSVTNPSGAIPTPSTVSLADEPAVKQILVDTLFGLWATINNLTRLRPSGYSATRDLPICEKGAG